MTAASETGFPKGGEEMSRRIDQAVDQAETTIDLVHALGEIAEELVGDGRARPAAEVFWLAAQCALDDGLTGAAYHHAAAAATCAERGGSTAQADRYRLFCDVVLTEETGASLPDGPMQDELASRLRAVMVLRPSPHAGPWRWSAVRASRLRPGERRRRLRQLRAHRRWFLRQGRTDLAAFADEVEMSLRADPTLSWLASRRAQHRTQRIGDDEQTAWVLYRRAGSGVAPELLPLWILLTWVGWRLAGGLAQSAPSLLAGLVGLTVAFYLFVSPGLLLVRARRRAREAGDGQLEVACDAALATWLRRGIGRLVGPRVGAETALRALVELDRSRYSWQASQHRAAYAAARTEAYEEVFRRWSHWPDLLRVELVEMARLQGVPRADADGDAATDLPIRVPADDTWLDARPDKLAERCGGPAAIWWGMWDQGRWLYWSLVVPSGPAAGNHSGRIRYGPRSRCRRAVAALEACLPFAVGDETVEDVDERVLAAGFAPDHEHQEQALSSRLADRLVPRPLAHRLADSIRTGTPSAIVVAPAPATARVPFAALAMTGVEVHGRPARVVDAATVVLAPSAALLRALPSRPEHVSPPGTVLGIIDPSGDLHHTEQTSRACDRTLVGAAATQEALRDTLGQRGLGVLVAAAHVAVTAGRRQAGIVLAGGDVVDPDALFRRPGGSTMPHDVVVAACSSSGLEPVTGGEWLGLAPALLWAGADRVVATLWPLWDTPATDHFTASIVGRVAAGRPPPEALRDLMIDALDATAASAPVNPSPADAPPAPGLVWASFVCVAARAAAVAGQPGPTRPLP